MSEQKRYLGQFEDKSEKPITKYHHTLYSSKSGQAKLDKLVYDYLKERNGKRTKVSDIMAEFDVRSVGTMAMSIERLISNGSLTKSGGSKGGYIYNVHGQVRTVPSFTAPSYSDNPIVTARGVANDLQREYLEYLYKRFHQKRLFGDFLREREVEEMYAIAGLDLLDEKFNHTRSN